MTARRPILASPARLVAPLDELAPNDPGAGMWSLVWTGKRPPTMNKTRGKTAHWSQRAAESDEWKQAYWALTRQQSVPQLTAFEVDAIPLHADLRSPQDTMACAPATKAAIDGIVLAMDGHPWNAPSKLIKDGPGRVVTITHRAPACGVGVDGLIVVVKALLESEVVASDAPRMLLVPASRPVVTMLALRVGRLDGHLLGQEAARMLDTATRPAD